MVLVADRVVKMIGVVGVGLTKKIIFYRVCHSNAPHKISAHLFMEGQTMDLQYFLCQIILRHIFVNFITNRKLKFCSSNLEQIGLLHNNIEILK